MTKLKLTIELVPSSSFYNNVRSAVTKAQWDIIRKQVYSKAYDLCEICGGTGPKHPVECHEIWSFNDKTLIQKLDGMIALCPNCHSVKHYGLAQIQNKHENALKHFMKVNSISKKKAEKYIAEAFMIWSKRSSKNWTVDISILKEYGVIV